MAVEPSTKKTPEELYQIRLVALAKARAAQAANRELGLANGRKAVALDDPKVKAVAKAPKGLSNFGRIELPKGMSILDLVPKQRPNLVITVELITPEIASEWLTHADTRPPRPSTVKKNANWMLTGQWGVSESNLCWDTNFSPEHPNGRLRNGRHRLLAVISTGLPQLFSVGRGYDPDDHASFDRPALRTLADFLYEDGRTRDNVLWRSAV